MASQRGQPCTWPSDSPGQMLVTEATKHSGSKLEFWGQLARVQIPLLLTFPLASFFFFFLFGLGTSVSLSVQWVYFPGLLQGN